MCLAGKEEEGIGAGSYTPGLKLLPRDEGERRRSPGREPLQSFEGKPFTYPPRLHRVVAR